MSIEIKPGESIDSAIKRFKRKCDEEGILKEVKKAEFYKSPSVLKKEKLASIKRKYYRYRRRRK